MDSNALVEERPPPITFGDEELSDVTITVENQDFLVHRMTLACRSPYFKAMFYGDFKEAKEDRVEIKGVSADIFKRILEIFYNGFMSDHRALKCRRCRRDSAATPRDPCLLVALFNYYAELKEFWDLINELLPAADLFDVTEVVLLSIQREISVNLCGTNDCFVCFNLFMFAFQKNMPILDKFPIFKKEDYNVWRQAVFRYHVKLVQIPFQIDFAKMVQMHAKLE